MKRPKFLCRQHSFADARITMKCKLHSEGHVDVSDVLARECMKCGKRLMDVDNVIEAMSILFNNELAYIEELERY